MRVLLWATRRGAAGGLSARRTLHVRKLAGKKKEFCAATRDYSIFDSSVYRNRALKWLFSQEKATSHAGLMS
jgi:hypothetical protein